MGATVRLPDANKRIYLAEPRLIDTRAVYAFRQGQCHALALALHEKTGWEMFLIADAARTFEHIAVRRDDQTFVDIGAEFTDADIQRDTPAAEIRAISRTQIDALVTESGWAPYELDAARLWVEAVLSGDRKFQAEPTGTPEVSIERPFGDGHEIRLLWRGSEEVTLSVRSIGEREWEYWGHKYVAPDSDDLIVIDFNEEGLDDLFRLWTPG